MGSSSIVFFPGQAMHAGAACSLIVSDPGQGQLLLRQKMEVAPNWTVERIEYSGEEQEGGEGGEVVHTVADVEVSVGKGQRKVSFNTVSPSS